MFTVGERGGGVAYCRLMGRSGPDTTPSSRLRPLLTDMARGRRPRLRERERVREICLWMEVWTAWPMPATTRTGVPRARAQGLTGGR